MARPGRAAGAARAAGAPAAVFIIAGRSSLGWYLSLRVSVTLRGRRPPRVDSEGADGRRAPVRRVRVDCRGGDGVVVVVGGRRRVLRPGFMRRIALAVSASDGDKIDSDERGAAAAGRQGRQGRYDTRPRPRGMARAGRRLTGAAVLRLSVSLCLAHSPRLSLRVAGDSALFSFSLFSATAGRPIVAETAQAGDAREPTEQTARLPPMPPSPSREPTGRGEGGTHGSRGPGHGRPAGREMGGERGRGGETCSFITKDERR